MPNANSIHAVDCFLPTRCKLQAACTDLATFIWVLKWARLNRSKADTRAGLRAKDPIKRAIRIDRNVKRRHISFSLHPQGLLQRMSAGEGGGKGILGSFNGIIHSAHIVAECH